MRATTRLKRYGLVVVMALGTLSIWNALPLAWILLASALQISNGLRFLLVLVGAPTTMIAVARELNRVSGAYERLSGRRAGTRAPHGYLKSVSDERDSRRLTLLETFLVISAVIAIVSLVVWFAFFAHSPSPSGPTAPGNEHGS